MNIKVKQLKKLVELAEEFNCEQIETLFYLGTLEIEMKINETTNAFFTFRDNQPELTEMVFTKKSKL